MKHSRAHRSQNTAFTLVETLLALALSSVLLVAIFGLINSTLNHHVTGSDQVLVSQRKLGLLQDLRMDIRSVPVDPHWQAIPNQIVDDRTLELATLQLPQQLELTNQKQLTEPLRLAGQADWLLLTLGHANPRWPGDAEIGQQIVWSLGGRGSLVVWTHDNSGQPISRTLAGLPASFDVVRTRMAADSQMAAGHSCVVAASQLHFRYLADGRWHNSWNSAQQKRLPDAIEVRVQCQGDSALQTWVIQTAASQEPGGRGP